MPGSSTFDSRGLLPAVASLLEGLHAPGGLREVLQRILDNAVTILGANRGDFVILRRGQLEIGAVNGERRAETRAQGDPCPEGSFIKAVWDGNSDEPQIVGDVTQTLETGKDYYCSDRRTISEAACRLMFRGRKVGVLNVESPRRNAFERRGHELKLLAEYAAIAIQVIQEETRSHELVEKVLGEEAPDEPRLRGILEEILDAVHDLYGFTSGLVYIAEGNRLEVRGAYGTRKDPFGYGIRDVSATTHVFNTSEGYFSPDVRQNRDGKVGSVGVEFFNISGSLVAVPLVFRGDRVGVLVSWSTSAEAPARWHLERLKPLATLAAWKISMWKEQCKRRDAEEQMRLYKSVVDHLPLSIFRKNNEGMFTYANEWFVRHLGQHSARDVVGKYDKDFYVPKCVKHFHEIDQEVMRSGQSRRISESNQLIGSDREIQAEGYKVPTRDDNGSITGVQGVFLDVSKHTNVIRQMGGTLDSLQQQVRTMNAQARQLTEDSKSLQGSLEAAVHATLLILSEQDENYRTLSETAPKTNREPLLPEGPAGIAQAIIKAAHEVPPQDAKEVIKQLLARMGGP